MTHSDLLPFAYISGPFASLHTPGQRSYLSMSQPMGLEEDDFSLWSPQQAPAHGLLHAAAAADSQERGKIWTP
jgi:hypothetical protein